MYIRMLARETSDFTNEVSGIPFLHFNVGCNLLMYIVRYPPNLMVYNSAMAIMDMLLDFVFARVALIRTTLGSERTKVDPRIGLVASCMALKVGFSGEAHVTEGAKWTV